MTEKQKESLSTNKLLLTFIGLLVIIIFRFSGWEIKKLQILGFELAPPATPTLAATTDAAFQVQPSSIPQQAEQQPGNSPKISAIISEPVEVGVSAKKGWQATGVIIKVGDIVEIRHKEGLWQSTENEILFGPDPNLTSDPIDKCFPLPSDPGALIGMIGNYEPFKIGYLYETTSNVQGELFLRMNACDQWLYDNRDEFEGGIRVLISIAAKP